MIIPFNKNSLLKIIADSLEIIKGGGIIAYPTESFYALGVLATNEKALENLFLLKKRPIEKPLPLIVGGPEALAAVVKTVPDRAIELMKRFWPGPLTIVFEAADNVSDLLTAGTGRVAVRVPGDSIALHLAREAGFPITATSANISSEPPADNADAVLNYFGDSIDLIIDVGKTPGGRPSTIVDVTTDTLKILREGSIILQT
ncbi:MAG TPA: threonylcarbamoyl-AMP synthase [Desulfobacteraceae bacterium]|nr:threonylcarbamoyl-AMP synthase [Desulfobacteraceae bacterium]